MRTITPRRPQNGLFAVATEVPSNDPAIDWAGGGWGLRSACPSGTIECCDPELNPNGADPEPFTPEDVRFKPFSITNVQGCTAGTSRTVGALADAREANRVWHDTNLEGWVSAGLELGMCDSPSLADLPDVDPDPDMTYGWLPSAAATLLKARQGSFAAGTPAIFDRPTLHLPSYYITTFEYDLSRFENTFDVVYGTGYGYFRTDNKYYAYITGPVEYSILDEYVPDSTLDERRQNMNYDRRETFAIVRFDPCGSYRIRIA